jgi:hypothetical protein
MPSAPTHSVQKAQDDNVRMEAALLYANGDHRGAINSLIARINTTNGHCNVRLWLELLDIYQAKDLQSPFEKLAGHFSSRFHLSPPAWANTVVSDSQATQQIQNKDGDAAEKKPNNVSSTQNTEDKRPGARSFTGGGRVALLIEGSALDVSTDKIRDVSRAAKQHRQCRLDLSRMMLFEVLQWRGAEAAFDEYVNAYADLFSNCPVGFESSEVIARDPTHSNNSIPVIREEEVQKSSTGKTGIPDNLPLNLNGEILDIQTLTAFAQAQWAKRRTAVIMMDDVTRLEAGAARSLATFLQVRTTGLGFTKDKPLMDFQQCSEAVASLLEGTGVSAYARIGTRHDKIRAVVHENGE